MSEEKTTKAAAPAKATAAPADVMVKMQHEATAHDDTLGIGEEVFPVTAGVVMVPLRLVEAAELAGFRRVG